MSGDLLFDTNAAIGLWAGDPSITAMLRGGSRPVTPCIVIGELVFGAQRSARSQQNLARVLELAESMPVLDCDAETGRHYGSIKHALRVAGRPIPANDLWIAALGSQYKMPLLTNDRHFDHVSNLSIVRFDS